MPQLDGVRGIAILMVVACQYFHFADIPAIQIHPLVRLAALGWTGVDLFFVLSGFLLGGLLLDHKGHPHYYRRFYLRRVGRILPLYYVWLLFCAIAGLGRAAPYYLVFAQNWAMAIWDIPTPALLFISWPLCIEEQFYLVVPVLVSRLSRKNLCRAAVAFLAAAPLLRAAARHIIPLHNASLFVLPVTHGDGLALGVLLAAALRSEQARRWYAQHRRGILAAAAGLACWSASGLLQIKAADFAGRSPFFTPIALAAGALVLESVAAPAGAVARICRVAPLRFFGKISYCLYLVHWPILQFVANWVMGNHDLVIHSYQGMLRMVELCSISALGIAVGICWLSYRYFEQPILRCAAVYAGRTTSEVSLTPNAQA